MSQTTNQLYQTSLNPMNPPFSYGVPMVQSPLMVRTHIILPLNRRIGESGGDTAGASALDAELFRAGARKGEAFGALETTRRRQRWI